MKALVISALLLLVAGCATVDICRDGRTMVDIENTGWYLFNVIPIASGDPDRPNENTCVWFSESVTLDNNIRMLEATARREHMQGIRNLTSYMTDENIFIILLKRHAYHTSAELTVEKNENE